VRAAPLAAAVLIGIPAQGIAQPPGPTAEGVPWFEEVADAAGLRFRHFRTEPPEYRLPEIMAGGAGWCDYDADGHPDLYAVQAGVPGGASTSGNRLFRNLGNGRFEDATERAGVGDEGFGMGVACGDADGDGDLDLYVTNLGPNVLYRNEGDGTFKDVTATAGVGDPGWSTSAAFLDYDRDGDLDLFTVNYIHWSPENEIECRPGGQERDYCHPRNYRAPASDRLYRNDGSGVFSDVTESSGIGATFGNGLGVAVGDYDGDGSLDVFVANDGMPNQLWVNLGDGRFEDRALIAGCAVNLTGAAEAGMGVASGDLDGDGDLDLLLTHLRAETNTLYVNTGDYFDDGTSARGLSAPSLDRTGFGVGFADFDHDGRLDVFVADGRVGRATHRFVDADAFAEPDLLLRQDAAGRFSEVHPPGGVSPALLDNGRAAAFADYDSDGDVDVAVVVNGGPLRLLRNVAPKAGGWIAFALEETPPRSADGARVQIAAGGAHQSRTVQSAYSYCAANERRVHFGLGRASSVDEVTVVWTDGQRERFGPFDGSSTYNLRRGTGIP
jgi:hypothetical protein